MMALAATRRQLAPLKELLTKISSHISRLSMSCHFYTTNASAGSNKFDNAAVLSHTHTHTT